jgi:RND family efflux transporter MFP subunit
MKLSVKSILITVVVIAAGVGLVINKKAHLAKESPPAATPVVIALRELAPASVTLTQATVADVLAVRDTILSSKLSAYVAALPFYEGDRFKRGQLLAKLDTSPANAGQSQGNSLVTDAAAAASAYQAENERLIRSRRLHEIGGVSLEQLQAAQAATAAARARLTLANENLASTTLTAPFAGQVSQRLVQPGDLVTPGKPLLKLVDTAAGVRLVVTMPEGRTPVGLRLKNETLPLKAWPEAAAQGGQRYEARTMAAGFMPGSRAPVTTVLFSGTGIQIPRECTLNSDGHHATLLRVAGQKVEAVTVELVAEGEEGAVTQDKHAAGAIACASPDILARLEAGTPFVAGR